MRVTCSDCIAVLGGATLEQGFFPSVEYTGSGTGTGKLCLPLQLLVWLEPAQTGEQEDWNLSFRCRRWDSVVSGQGCCSLSHASSEKLYHRPD